MAADVATSPRRKPRRNGAKRARPAEPAVVVCGAGVGGLQLTLAAYGAILASGAAFTVGVDRAVVDHLRSARVRVTELDDIVAAAADYTDGYLTIIDSVLHAAKVAPPAVLVVPGNPMAENSVTRALVSLCRRHDLQVEVHASVSPVDALVNDLGLDIDGRGLQVFSARTLLARRIAVNPDVPLHVYGLDALADPALAKPGVAPAAYFARLEQHIGSTYSSDHPVSHLIRLTGRGALEHRTVALRDAGELWHDVGPGSSLFVGPRQ